MSDDELSIYWCKTASGELVEHITTPYRGHRGHRHCIPVKPAPASSLYSEGTEGEIR